MPEKIKIEKKDGTVAEAEIIAAFDITDFGRKYVIYSFNEVDPNGLAKLNASQVIEENGQYTFAKVETDDEWTRIKDVMRNIITEGTNQSYTFAPNFLANYKPDDVIKQTGANLVALQQNGKDKMKSKMAEEKAKVQPVEEPAEQLDISPTIPDASNPTVANPTPPVEFQAVPEDVNNTSLDNTPLATTVEPLNLNSTPEVQNPQPIQAEQPVQMQNSQPETTENITTTSNALSDDKLKKIDAISKEICDIFDIRNSEDYKDTFSSNICGIGYQIKNIQNMLDHIDTRVFEISKVVEDVTTAVKATTALQQNAQVDMNSTQQTINSAQNSAQVNMANNPVQNGATQPTVNPNVQTQTNNGPIYSYQQAA